MNMRKRSFRVRQSVVIISMSDVIVSLTRQSTRFSLGISNSIVIHSSPCKREFRSAVLGYMGESTPLRHAMT